MIAEQEALSGLPHPGEVPGPLVHDFFTTGLRHFYADPDSHPQAPTILVATSDFFVIGPLPKASSSTAL